MSKTDQQLSVQVELPGGMPAAQTRRAPSAFEAIETLQKVMPSARGTWAPVKGTGAWLFPKKDKIANAMRDLVRALPSDVPHIKASLAKRIDALESGARFPDTSLMPTEYPMYVVSRTVLERSSSMPKHEDLKARGELVVATPDMIEREGVLFVSHRWESDPTSANPHHPDPRNAQMDLLKKSLSECS